MLWIRIQIGYVLSDFMDPNPYSEYGSQSTQLKIGKVTLLTESSGSDTFFKHIWKLERKINLYR